jgi:hypothetical protein
MEEMTNGVAISKPYTPSKQRITPEFAPGVPEVELRPIAPTLKALKIGGKAYFPTEQRSSLYATIYRLRKDYKRQGWDVKISESEDEYTIYVIRVS